MIQLLRNPRVENFLEKKKRSHVIRSSYLIKVLLLSLAWCRKCKCYLSMLPEDNQRLSFMSPFVPITEIAPVPPGKIRLSWSLLPIEGAPETCPRGLKEHLPHSDDAFSYSETSNSCLEHQNHQGEVASKGKQSCRPGHNLFFFFKFQKKIGVWAMKRGPCWR